MLRSLFGGVSGLQNHQTLMDVIGNNIANVNTTAFKAGRVTFKESLALMLQGAQRPSDQRGGINPMQVGLGMSVASIDADFSQGNLENTGQVTDMAIQGDGFFILNDGTRDYYTRAGNFKLDANGQLVSPNTGFILQGRMADSTGAIAEGSPIEDIVLPFGTKIPAKATTEVNLTGNLDAGGVALGTILNSAAVYAIEEGESDIEGLVRRNPANGEYAEITGMAANSTEVTVNDGQGNETTYTYVGEDIGLGDDLFHSMADLLDEIDNDFGSKGLDTLSVDLDKQSGQIVVSAGTELQVKEDTSHKKTNGEVVAAGTTWENVDTTGTGTSDVANGDVISYSGATQDGTAFNGSYTVADVTADTVGDLLSSIESDIQAVSGGSDVTVSIDNNGRITLTDANNGTSQLALDSLSSDNAGGGSLSFGSFDFHGTEVNISSTNNELQNALAYANGDLSDGSTAYSHEFSHVATADADLTKLRTHQGVDMKVNSGDTITLEGNKGGEEIASQQLVVGTDISTYRELTEEIKQAFSIKNAEGVEIDAETGALTINADGGTLNEISDVNIVVNQMWYSDRAYRDFNTGEAITESTAWTDLDTAGGSNDIALTDTIEISGKKHDGTLVNTTYTLNEDVDGDGGATDGTVVELLNKIENLFGNVDAYISDGTDGNVAGTLVVKDLDGGDSELEVTLVENNESGGSLDFGTLTASTWNSVFDDTPGNYYEEQEAEDYTQNASIAVYDTKGTSHVLSFTFTKNPVEVNKWTWEAEVNSDEATVVSGGSGVITFDSEGNLNTFTYDEGAQALRFAPGNGAGFVDIDVMAGSTGTIDGLSQFAGSANAIVESQDGYSSGDLNDITINDTGNITGSFSNGVSRTLAQVVLADFNNPNGLVRRGDNLYEVSGNSGQPIVGEAGKTIQSKIASGNLEQSNVELADEFTKMIVAQRGFQANARVLTVSDQLLQEVVGLKR